MLPVDLPANFPFADFKGLGSGSSQAIALPFQLSGAAPPASGLQSLTQSFIGSIGFAFAADKEYVSEPLRSSKDFARRSRAAKWRSGSSRFITRFRFSSAPR